MLESSERARCPVCAAPYANVTYRIRVVGVNACSRGGIVIGAAMTAVLLLGCGINTWLVYCCGQRDLSADEDFVVCFSAILMTSVGFALVAYVGRECVATGPVGLVCSALIRKRNVCVGVGEMVLGELAISNEN